MNCRQNNDSLHPLSRLAPQDEATTVPRDDVLDQRQTQPGAPLHPAFARIDAVKALGEAW